MALNDRKYRPHFTIHLKKGKYYVSVTVPKDLRHLFSDKQIRRSTGTSDKRVANERSDKIYNRILDQLNEAADQLDPFIEGLRPYLEQGGVDVSQWYRDGVLTCKFTGKKSLHYEMLGEETVVVLSETGKEKLKIVSEAMVTEEDSYSDVAVMVTRLGFAIPKHLIEMLPDDAKEEVLDLKRIPTFNALKLLDDPQKWQNGKGLRVIENLQANPPNEMVKVTENTSNVKRFSELIEGYLKHHNSEAVKEQSQRKKACERVIEFCGDLLIDKYTPLHAYDLAQAMHELDYSNAQINKMITYGRGLFKYAQKIRNEYGQPVLLFQPWVDIDLKKYGVPQRSYLPFSHDELHAIFDLKLPKQERLLLSILITTGMRLDEVALMTWDRIKFQNGVLCFSLVNDSQNVRVKTTGSHRYVPIPDIIKKQFGNGGEGRVFDYRIDRDGKAQAAASDAVMPYIRLVTQYDRKVAHSMRGNFKDLVRELEISKELNDFITGHSQGDVAGRYGSGPSLAKRLELMNRIEHPWLL